MSKTSGWIKAVPGMLIGSLIISATPARADVKAGVDAWARGDNAGAVREWQPLADRGDPDAQFNLGQAYKLGRGVPQDLAKAEALFAKAAAQGHVQAADAYGLLLFQRGERTLALPYLQAASERGDPRAQYLMGLAYFNGELVPRDWVRAYALTSLAHQSGLGHAGSALAEMDKHIPPAQRQRGTALAAQLAAKAQASRNPQVSGVSPNTSAQTPVPNEPPAARPAKPPRAARHIPAPPPPAATSETPPALLPAPAPIPMLLPLPAPAPARQPVIPPESKTPARAASPVNTVGLWRVQLGAFTRPDNANSLWNRIKARPELAGRSKLLVPSGRLTKLQAGGFDSSRDAQAACRHLTAAGHSCLPVRN